jgi:hypothetical protein
VGWADCNSNLQTDGCETDTTVDGNCGACNVTCSADACRKAVCGLAGGNGACATIDLSACATPFCALPSGTCSWKDTDGDGLADAWEENGFIDMNCNGVYDASDDIQLPGADPLVPDLYIQWDFMQQASGTNPAGDGPHCHVPPPALFSQLTEAFAAHNIRLHWIDPAGYVPGDLSCRTNPSTMQPGAIAESFVTTRDASPSLSCVCNATSCPANTWVTMQTLRAAAFAPYASELGPHLQHPAYHYLVFAHSAVVPDTAPCCDPIACAPQACNACPTDPLCGGHPDPSSSGNADVYGDDVIVALGTLGDNVGLDSAQFGVETWASITMHEIGHNLGLVHGSLAASTDPVLTTQQEQCLAWKPNFLSVMDYRYAMNGISVATAPGSTTNLHCDSAHGDADCPAGAHCTTDLGGPGTLANQCYRVDYASTTLLTLDESALDETTGVQGPSTDQDIVTYCDSTTCGLSGPSFGFIDWNGNGLMETSTAVDVDGNPVGPPNRKLDTTSDWDKLQFTFQCSTSWGAGGPADNPAVGASEVGLAALEANHVLLRPLSVDRTETRGPILTPGLHQETKMPR